jgi:tetratricopeptide (TPR) repeat protein
VADQQPEFEHRMDPMMPPVARFLATLIVLSPLACARAQDRIAAAATKPQDAQRAAQTEQQLSERVERLIEQLGHREYALRELAQEELDTIGPPAFDALMEAHRHRDLEISHRAKFLIDKIRREAIASAASPEIKKLLENYESQPDAERLAKLRQLARMSQEQALATLCRLVRFERSQQVAKQGAILIFDQKQSGTTAASQARRKTILDQVALSSRPAVRWLRAYGAFPQAPSESLDEWRRFLADEEELLKQSASSEQNEIVAGLLRQQVLMLLAQNQTEPALAALRRLLDLKQADTDGLSAVVDWIIENQAWALIEEVGKRFEGQQANNPELLYALAHAHELKGDATRAEELAERALAIKHATPGEGYNLGNWLRRGGMLRWAEKEFKKVIEGPDEPRLPNIQQWARLALADLVADQERYSDAANIYDEVVAWLDKNPAARNELRRSPNEIRAKAHHYRAKHFAAEKDTARQLEQLNLALKHDAREADVLIALYRLPGQDEAAKKETRAKIKMAADHFRQQIAASPDDPQAMNNFAWLVANTEGDYDEAAQWSHRSIELLKPQNPAIGGLLDTLAHCYAAKRDYEKALEYQSQAIELEPHSGEIRRAYERFKKAAEASKAAGAR